MSSSSYFDLSEFLKRNKCEVDVQRNTITLGNVHLRDLVRELEQRVHSEHSLVLFEALQETQKRLALSRSHVETQQIAADMMAKVQGLYQCSDLLSNIEDAGVTSDKVIFLDIDGVLITTRTQVGHHKTPRSLGDFDSQIHAFDHTALALLRGLCKGQDIQIVLSSVWRILTPVNTLAHYLNLPIVDRTERRTTREGEIQKWLGENPQIEQYAILDDMALKGERIDGHFVHINGHEGLSWEKFTELCSHFEANPHEGWGSKKPIKEEVVSPFKLFFEDVEVPRVTSRDIE